MRWLEIIELRTGGYAREELQKALENLVEDVSHDPENPEVQLYRSYAVATDYSIHLGFHGSGPRDIGSALGVRIATLLKPYGLVNHTVWTRDEVNHNDNVIATQNE